MSTTPRDEAAIRSTYNRVLNRVRRTEGAGEPVREGDGAWLEALKWALGGCLQPYHPPECNGSMESCYGSPEGSSDD